MERKYYLRGLGIGIAVTAIIMGIALSGDKAMTDDEIIARAKELGMVENTVLSDTGSDEAENADDEHADESNAANQTQDIADAGQSIEPGDISAADDEEDIMAESDEENQTASEDGEEAEPEAEPEEDGEDEQEQEAEEEPEDEDGRQETPNESITSSAVRVITINSGDGSYTVAKKLADVGVVTSASTFDNFLCEHGYDKRLRTGTFSIPADASDEQIARIVTGIE